MTTRAKATPEPTHPVAKEFGKYPLYKVVSVFEDHAAVDAAVDELREHNFEVEDIEAYCGIEGGKELDFEGVQHGTWTKFLRAVQHAGRDSRLE